VYYGDERCLPADHADRNSTMAEESWLRHVDIPADQVHAMPAELGPDEAAQRYCGLLKGVDAFDCVLLGMGEDAHTASLFPGQAWEGAAHAPAIAVRNSPKPPSERVSLSASRLSDARQVMFFVTGAGKREAVQLWKAGAALPVASIKPASGIDVYMDMAACP
jgi:6-phosphogluconolactonase